MKTISQKLCLQHTAPGMFADDTYITMAHEDISTIECSLNSDLAAVHDWLQTNKLGCNTSKTSYIQTGQNRPDLVFYSV